MAAQPYLQQLLEKLRTFDKNGAEDICQNLIKYLNSTNERFEASGAEKIMQQLRSKRMFKLMLQVGDAFIQSGRDTFKIRKLYAQALIDQNILTAAISVLKDLIGDTDHVLPEAAGAKVENTEAKGLMGRVYKQLYLNANRPLVSQNAGFIKDAINYYLQVYQTDVQKNTWHGINVVALILRAQRDGINPSGFPDAKILATQVLETIEAKHSLEEADAWDFATAGEACIALDRPKEALEWFSGYARMPYCDAFELASTLRQLEEVWRMNMNSESGSLILPLLRAELLKREGGNILTNSDDFRKQKLAEGATTATFQAMVTKTKDANKVVLEKVFGEDSFKTYKWYMLGSERCRAVARIGRDSSKGFGTGFLLKGTFLHPSLQDELILVTNAHVVSDDPGEKSLRSHEAIIIFETLDRDEEFCVGEILFSSPSRELDTTIIRFKKEDQERLKELTKGVKIYPVSEHLPIIDKDDLAERIYIIGHPYGGTLQLSFQDNILLDHEDPKIHYRTPTEGGSSGSPVFNQQWELIGLHHSGSAQMNCLNGKAGTYEANEGFWIQTIIKKFNETFRPSYV
jgi:V8-like Glu-specific endopeptidase